MLGPPATGQRGAKRERVKVCFPRYTIGRDLLLCHLHPRFAPPTLPGGFKVGETVLSLFAHQTTSLNRADRDRVAYNAFDIILTGS